MRLHAAPHPDPGVRRVVLVIAVAALLAALISTALEWQPLLAPVFVLVRSQPPRVRVGAAPAWCFFGDRDCAAVASPHDDNDDGASDGSSDGAAGVTFAQSGVDYNSAEEETRCAATTPSPAGGGGGEPPPRHAPQETTLAQPFFSTTEYQLFVYLPRCAAVTVSADLDTTVAAVVARAASACGVRVPGGAYVLVGRAASFYVHDMSSPLRRVADSIHDGAAIAWRGQLRGGGTSTIEYVYKASAEFTLDHLLDAARDAVTRARAVLDAVSTDRPRLSVAEQHAAFYELLTPEEQQLAKAGAAEHAPTRGAQGAHGYAWVTTPLGCFVLGGCDAAGNVVAAAAGAPGGGVLPLQQQQRRCSLVFFFDLGYVVSFYSRGGVFPINTVVEVTLKALFAQLPVLLGAADEGAAGAGSHRGACAVLFQDTPENKECKGRNECVTPEARAERLAVARTVNALLNANARALGVEDVLLFALTAGDAEAGAARALATAFACGTPGVMVSGDQDACRLAAETPVGTRAWTFDAPTLLLAARNIVALNPGAARFRVVQWSAALALLVAKATPQGHAVLVPPRECTTFLILAPSDYSDVCFESGTPCHFCSPVQAARAAVAVLSDSTIGDAAAFCRETDTYLRALLDKLKGTPGIPQSSHYLRARAVVDKSAANWANFVARATMLTAPKAGVTVLGATFLSTAAPPAVPRTWALDRDLVTMGSPADNYYSRYMSPLVVLALRMECAGFLAAPSVPPLCVRSLAVGDDEQRGAVRARLRCTCDDATPAGSAGCTAAVAAMQRVYAEGKNLVTGAEVARDAVAEAAAVTSGTATLAEYASHASTVAHAARGPAFFGDGARRVDVDFAGKTVSVTRVDPDKYHAVLEALRAVRALYTARAAAEAAQQHAAVGAQIARGGEVVRSDAVAAYINRECQLVRGSAAPAGGGASVRASVAGYRVGAQHVPAGKVTAVQDRLAELLPKLSRDASAVVADQVSAVLQAAREGTATLADFAAVSRGDAALARGAVQVYPAGVDCTTTFHGYEFGVPHVAPVAETTVRAAIQGGIARAQAFIGRVSAAQGFYAAIHAAASCDAAAWAQYLDAACFEAAGAVAGGPAAVKPPTSSAPGWVIAPTPNAAASDVAVEVQQPRSLVYCFAPSVCGGWATAPVTDTAYADVEAVVLGVVARFHDACPHPPPGGACTAAVGVFEQCSCKTAAGVVSAVGRAVVAATLGGHVDQSDAHDKRNFQLEECSSDNKVQVWCSEAALPQLREAVFPLITRWQTAKYAAAAASRAALLLRVHTAGSAALPADFHDAALIIIRDAKAAASDSAVEDGGEAEDGAIDEDAPPAHDLVALSYTFFSCPQSVNVRDSVRPAVHDIARPQLDLLFDSFVERRAEIVANVIKVIEATASRGGSRKRPRTDTQAVAVDACTTRYDHYLERLSNRDETEEGEDTISPDDTVAAGDKAAAGVAAAAAARAAAS